MRRRTVLILAGALAAVVAVTAIGVLTWPDDGAPPTSLRYEYPPGERPPAPPIAGELLDGSQLDVADLRGDVVVVNVWATWCPPCREETDDLEAVYQQTRDLGVSFVGVNILDERDLARAFLAGRVTYPSIFDPASSYGLGFEEPPPPIAPPATLVIDRTGHLATAIYRQVGQIELEQVVTEVAMERALAGG